MTAVPVPSRPLALLPALTRAAAEAAAVDPQTLIRRWLDSKSPTARRTYRRALLRFAAWAIEGGEHSPEDGMRLLVESGPGPAHSMVERWRDELLEQGLAPGTVAGQCTALASLVRCCRRAGLCSWSLEGVAPRAERRHDRSGPRRGDVERLVAFVDDAAEHANTAARRRRAVRDAAVLRLLYSAGLRRSEAAQLRVEDVDLSAPCVRPRRKGKREREAVSISAGTAAALHRWLELRGTTPGWLFTRTDRGDDSVPIAGETIRRLLSAWAARAGLRGTIRPHGLRHSGATEVAAHGTLAQLMSYGGWRSMSSASQYLDKREEERAAALAVVDL